MNEQKDKKIEYLKLVDNALIIEKCDGQRDIANATDIFSLIDPNFRNLKMDEVGYTTPDTPVNIYELVKDGMFSELFGSLTSN